MSITLWGLKTCDTCRKARKALEAAGQSVTFRDVRDTPPSPGDLEKWLEIFEAEALVNRRSTTWRELDDATRGAALGAGTTNTLIAHPTLMKRPLFETPSGDRALGFKSVEATLAALGLRDGS